LSTIIEKLILRGKQLKKNFQQLSSVLSENNAHVTKRRSGAKATKKQERRSEQM
jgi:hypothetical protein